MSLFIGILFITGSLLVLRALKLAYDRPASIHGLADGLIVNFVIPATSAGLVAGAAACVVGLRAVPSLAEVGGAGLVVAAFYLGWRGLGRLRTRSNVVPFTPKPVTSDQESPRRAA
jgi:hypothetical protein